MIRAEVPPALNTPAAGVPQASFTPWTEKAPTGSSTRMRSEKGEDEDARSGGGAVVSEDRAHRSVPGSRPVPGL